MGFRLRQDFGGRVGGTGKVYESENDGEIEKSTSIQHSLFAFSLRPDLLPVGHSPDEAEGPCRQYRDEQSEEARCVPPRRCKMLGSRGGRDDVVLRYVEQATGGLPIGRVASATAPDARRRDDVDAVPSSRSENTAGGVVPRQPFGRKGLRVTYFVPVRRKGLHPVFLTAPRI